MPALLRVKEGFLPVLAMPERRPSTLPAEKAGLAAKVLVTLSRTVDPDS